MRWAAAAAWVGVVLGAAGAAGGASPVPRELIFASTRAPDLHDELYVLDTETGVQRPLAPSPTRDGLPTISPDRTTIAFASDRGGTGDAVWVASPTGDSVRRLHAPVDGSITGIHWSSDGRWIAFSLSRYPSGAVYLLPTEGGNAQRIAAGWSVAWVHNSLMAVSAIGGVSARDLSGKELWRASGTVVDVSQQGELAIATEGRIEVVDQRGIRRLSVPGTAPAYWSPDGSVLAYTGPANVGLRLVDRANSVRVLSGTISIVGDWAPDGRSLLGSRPGGAVSVALDGRTTPVALSGGKWSPGGSRLLGPAADGSVSVWQPGSQPRRLIQPPVGEPCPVYTRAFAWLDERQVVFQRGRDGKHDPDLWAVSATGGSPRRIHGGNDWAAAPEASPNGSRIAYESGDVITHAEACAGPVIPQLRITSTGGHGDRLLTPASRHHFNHGPRWSPDGSRVAFHRTDLADGGEFGVFVIEVASRKLRRFTVGFGEGPSWAPDGRRLAFSGKGGVWIANLRTGKVVRVRSGGSPEWSPGRSEIAFTRGDEVWVMSPTGTHVRRLARAKALGELRWSHDASMLAFAVREGALVVGRNGTIKRRIAYPGATGLRFSRDNRTIAFVAPIGKRYSGSPVGFLGSELFVADLSGGPPRRITNDNAQVGAPAWR
jgi:Tol biopolymer transport system component